MTRDVSSTVKVEGSTTLANLLATMPWDYGKVLEQMDIILGLGAKWSTGPRF